MPFREYRLQLESFNLIPLLILVNYLLTCTYISRGLSNATDLTVQCLDNASNCLHPFLRSPAPLTCRTVLKGWNSHNAKHSPIFTLLFLLYSSKAPSLDRKHFLIPQLFVSFLHFQPHFGCDNASIISTLSASSTPSTFIIKITSSY